jgi:peptide/nickel transport system permease protein
MLSFIISRLFSTIIVIFGVVSIVFFLIHIVPGDPIEVMLGESAQIADKENLRIALGLNKPIFTQWYEYIGNVLQGNLGQSLHSKQNVTEMLMQNLPATLELAIASLFVAIIIALPLGSIATIKKNTFLDKIAMFFALLGISVPNFLMGPILILIFSIGLGWLPVSGKDNIFALILPALTLGTALAAILSRMIRSTLLEVLNEDYIRTARAKGLSAQAVILHHALRNASLPIITILGLQAGTLLGGAVITEIIFSWPGIGQLLINAIEQRDYPVVQACVLFISLSYVCINTLTDLLYAWFDPRIRFTT